MDDKTKAATEQEALDEVEVKANSNYETRNLHLVDGKSSIEAQRRSHLHSKSSIDLTKKGNQNDKV